VIGTPVVFMARPIGSTVALGAVEFLSQSPPLSSPAASDGSA
jgi:hypothetical protein